MGWQGQNVPHRSNSVQPECDVSARAHCRSPPQPFKTIARIHVSKVASLSTHPAISAPLEKQRSATPGAPCAERLAAQFAVRSLKSTYGSVPCVQADRVLGVCEAGRFVVPCASSSPHLSPLLAHSRLNGHRRCIVLLYNALTTHAAISSMRTARGSRSARSAAALCVLLVVGHCIQQAAAAGPLRQHKHPHRMRPEQQLQRAADGSNLKQDAAAAQVPAGPLLPDCVPK